MKRKPTVTNGKPTKVCLNPGCKRQFTPGHYGDRQRICGQRKCKKWYKGYWSQVRKPPRGIPTEDFDRILVAVGRDLRKRALVIVAAQSGLRKGELLGLTWTDVMKGDEVKQIITLRGQWDDNRGFIPTKTDAGRLAYLLEDSRAALTKVAQVLRKQKALKLDDRVFPYYENYVWSWWVELQKRLKIKNSETGHEYRWHDLRHHAGITTLQATGRLDRVQELLGHKNPATSAIYARERPEEFVAGLEQAFSKKRKAKS